MHNSGTQSSDVVKLQVPARPAYVGVIRLTISAVANRCGFDIEALEDIKVAVTEAVTNVILHCEECATVEVEAEFCPDPGCLTIKVADTGLGLAEDTIAEPNLADPSEEGGLGIFIIRSLMDEVEFLATPGNGTIVVMKKQYPALSTVEAHICQ